MRGDGFTLLPVRTVVRDSTTIFATIELTSSERDVVAAEDTFSLSLSDADRTTTRVNAFKLGYSAPHESGGSVFLHQISSPSAIRPGGTASITIAYSNLGVTDRIAPLLIISANGGGLRLADSDEFSTEVQVLAINRDGPAGILPAGAEGSVTVELQAPLSTSPFGSSINVSVRHPTACPPPAPAARLPSFALGSAEGEAGLVRRPSVSFDCIRQAAPIDWEAIQELTRPSAVPADAWDAILVQLHS